MKYFLLFLILSMSLLNGCGDGGSLPQANLPLNSTTSSAVQLTPLQITSQTGQVHDFLVELATTPATRQYGLMQRTSLPAGQGMLFLFPHAQVLRFWMKQTLIPLDMLFIDANGKILFLQAEAPPCTQDPCPSYGPSVPAKWVLELPGGTARTLGIAVGDMVSVQLPLDLHIE